MNYREIPSALRNRQPFQGNSMSAEVRPDGSYVVKSYATIIAVATPGHPVSINEDKWSRTTSRHQNLVKENLS
jgi:hypothetical protein